MNNDDTGVTTADTSEQMGLDGDEYEVDVGENGCELCEVFLDSNDLRKLGVPRGTTVVMFRVENGMILVSPAH